MSDTETIPLDVMLDGGAFGHIPVSVIGSVKAGPSPEYVEVKILSAIAHVLNEDLTKVLDWSCLHALDHISRTDICEKLEARWRQAEAAKNREPIYDFDGGAA